MSERSTEVYDGNIAGVTNPCDLRQAIARAVRQLREAMEKEDNRAVTAEHVRNLMEIDPEALAKAYALAEETCTYWPTPGQIRELAGWSEETRSRAGLQWVFNYLRQTRRGRTRARRWSEIWRRRDGTEEKVLLETEVVVAAAGDTGGHTSHSLGAGQRRGEAGPALCKSTSGGERLGQLLTVTQLRGRLSALKGNGFVVPCTPGGERRGHSPGPSGGWKLQMKR